MYRKTVPHRWNVLPGAVRVLLALFLTPTAPCFAGEEPPPTSSWAIEPRFIETKPFSDGLAPVLTEEGWGYIDRLGNMVVPPQFIQAGPFAEGLAPACTKAGFGYITHPNQ